VPLPPEVERLTDAPLSIVWLAGLQEIEPEPGTVTVAGEHATEALVAGLIQLMSNSVPDESAGVVNDPLPDFDPLQLPTPPDAVQFVAAGDEVQLIADVLPDETDIGFAETAHENAEETGLTVNFT
jgi:hypothetical protein